MLNDCASQLSGTKVYSMVIPNHSEFGVPERVRNYYEEASQRENTMAVNNTLSASITAVDIYDALNLHNNEDIYFDTDTHWAPLGAFYAYKIWLRRGWPLITAGIHVMFAYPIIRAILRAMMLSSETVFITCTVASFLVFSVLYAVVYALTAKVYYRIISEDNK